MVEYEFGELDELSLAYATSIHKSQGSEYPAVVIPLAMQHYLLLERNLLYTAVTRGKKLVIIIGQVKALAMAVKNRRSTKRVTKLAERIAAIHAESIPGRDDFCSNKRDNEQQVKFFRGNTAVVPEKIWYIHGMGRTA
jgi:ATP-dependent exoDNAse (exonuclease V) alpha subunit